MVKILEIGRHLRWKMASLLITTAALAALAACGAKDKSDPAPAAAGRPAPSATAGQLQINIASDVDPTTVQGYVVGQQDVKKIKSDGTGAFYINDIAPGKTDVIVTGALTVSALHLAGTKVGIRLDDVVISAGAVTEKKDLALPPLVTVSGTVKLNGQSDHAGIDAYIPGTGYTAKTDSAGKFTIADVPEGKHNFYFERSGYHRGQVENASLSSATPAHTLPDLIMALSTGASGFILLGYGSSTYTSMTVPVTVGATSDAVLMMISESSSFSGASWTAVVSSSTYTFAGDGAKTLYVRFADANGLESSAYSASITIDLNLWEAMATTGAPSVTDPSVVYVDGKLIVWGGTNSTFNPVATGAMYNFTTNTWTTMGTGPEARADFTLTAMQNGKVLLWGGSNGSLISGTLYNTGFVFNPSTNAWTAATLPSEDPRTSHRAAAIGNKVFIWGGKETASGSNYVNTGLIYDGATDTWAIPSTTGAPNGRYSHKIIAAGTKFIVWGGSETFAVNTGGVYDPTTDTWTTISSSGVTEVRENQAVLWTGSKLMVWGGYDTINSRSANDGGLYDLTAGSWTTVTTTGAPAARTTMAAVWAGDVAIVFGGANSGSGGSTNLSDGGIYNASTNTWSALSTVDSPSARTYGNGFWTGTKMIIWGGKISTGGLSNGATFTPP